MITQKPYGLSPAVSISIYGQKVDYRSINFLDIDLAPNKHDSVILTMTGLPSSAVTDYYYAPVEVHVSVGNGAQHYAFYGYVEEVKPYSFSGFGTVNNKVIQEARVVCLGASYNMRGSSTRRWDGYSLTEIATELAAKYKFSVDVPDVPVFSDSVLQTTESDWQFLTRYANYLGYDVTVHGTHIHVFDPHDAYTRGISYSKLSSVRDFSVTGGEFPGQILEFDGSFSTRNADGAYTETYLTVAQDDGTSYTVTTSDVYGSNGNARFPNRVSDVVDNYGEAERRIVAIKQEKYDYYADVRVLGLADCVPGGVVEMGDFGGDFEGLWCVKQVHHGIHRDAFYTELKLARNKKQVLVAKNTSRFQTAPTPYYNGNDWVSSKRRVNVYT